MSVLYLQGEKSEELRQLLSAAVRENRPEHTAERAGDLQGSDPYLSDGALHREAAASRVAAGGPIVRILGVLRKRASLNLSGLVMLQEASIDLHDWLIKQYVLHSSSQPCTA